MPNHIPDNCSISSLSDIEESTKGSVLEIGEHCHIDSFVKIKFAGGLGDIRIGNFCYLNSGCVVYSGNGIAIGNKVLIAANCTLAPVNHGFELKSSILGQPFMNSKGGITIEDDVWIGANSVILDGAHIGKGCVISAGSVVYGTLEPNGIYRGNPIQLVRKRT